MRKGKTHDGIACRDAHLMYQAPSDREARPYARWLAPKVATEARAQLVRAAERSKQEEGATIEATRSRSSTARHGERAALGKQRRYQLPEATEGFNGFEARERVADRRRAIADSSAPWCARHHGAGNESRTGLMTDIARSGSHPRSPHESSAEGLPDRPREREPYGAASLRQDFLNRFGGRHTRPSRLDDGRRSGSGSPPSPPAAHRRTAPDRRAEFATRFLLRSAPRRERR